MVYRQERVETGGKRAEGGILVIDGKGAERTEQRVPSLTWVKFPQSFLSGLVFPYHTCVGPCVVYSACGLLRVPFLLRPTFSRRVVEEDLPAFDAARIELRRVRRPRHIVLDIGRRERGRAGKLDTLVLFGCYVGHWVCEKTGGSYVDWREVSVDVERFVSSVWSVRKRPLRITLIVDKSTRTVVYEEVLLVPGNGRAGYSSFWLEKQTCKRIWKIVGDVFT